MNLFLKIFLREKSETVSSFIQVRPQDEEMWVRRYGVKMNEVSLVLDCIIKSFIIDPRLKYSLRPEDTLSEIYSIAVPAKSHVDSLEYETLVRMVKKLNGIDVSPLFLEGAAVSISELIGYIDGIKIRIEGSAPE
jgi:hypothetical protein